MTDSTRSVVVGFVGGYRANSFHENDGSQGDTLLSFG